ncbi:MAG: hypothetical protein HS119_01040 [Flavobacteriales bacterium]|nr:hypothetical protein [Flavobacteriales bacterium]
MNNKTHTHFIRIALVLALNLCFLGISYTQNDSILGSPIEDLLGKDSLLNTPSQPLNKTDTANNNSVLEGGETDLLLTGFNSKNIELKQGEIISNVLKVYNNSRENIKFTLDLIYPGSWQQLNDASTEYEAIVGDTIYIPIVLIPNKLINGNTEVIINAFLINLDKQQIANNYFNLRTKKKISWDVQVEPSNTFYFKNGETTKDFVYRIENTGNYKQDIFVNYSTLRGDLMLNDTNDLIIKNPNFTMSLESHEDTTLKYRASIITDRERNFRKIPINTYIPNTNLYYKKYSLYVNSSEPKGVDETTFKKGNKVDFVKLPNETKVEEFGYPHLPLIVEATAQNLLDVNSFMSLNMRGFKQLNQRASLSYFAQLNYNQNYYTNNFLTNSPWYVGYFDHNKTIEVGQISGNVIGITGYGKGIKASYSYLQKHKTGVFYVKSPGFFGQVRTESYGLFHTYTHNEYFNVTGKFGRQTSYISNKSINSFSLLPNFNIQRRHFFSFVGALTAREDYNPTTSNKPFYGYLIGGNYSSQFLEKKLRVNLGSRFNDRNFSTGAFQRFSINHRTSYNINDKWDTYLSNNYQNLQTYNTFTNLPGFKQEMLFNNLVFSTRTNRGSYQPGIYYDYRDYLANRIHARGITFRYSTYNFLQNMLASAFIKTGYSLPIDFEERKNYYTFEFSSLLRYKVWNFSTRYNYGALSTTAFQNQNYKGITPQMVRLSLQNQHQFKNKHLVLESNLVYNYSNVFKTHSIGLFPEIFYFTNSGWRFSIRGNYAINTSNYGSVYSTDTLVIASYDERERDFVQNFTLGATVRKEFGIPIPFIKKMAASVNFISFYDINGNGFKDKDEPSIENVVVRMGGKEVLTNNKGEADIKNIPMQTYPLFVKSLDDLTGWFPNAKDSIQIIANAVHYIPFVRGVKVYGDVVLDRQKIAVADTSKPFDLSRIKITATNGQTFNTLTDIKGKFEFYMPNGDYIITMDESILGNKYKLTRNNIPITLKNTQDGVYVSFYIIENRKKVVVKEFGTPNE